jgi:opacity protein-like surface antigen
LKKIILFLLLYSSIYADSHPYLGLSVGAYNEKFTEFEAISSSQTATLKAGYGDIKAYAVEFSFEYANNKSKIFSSSADTAHDSDKYGLNVNLLKSFDFDIYVLPFVKVGFGTGFLKIDRALQKNLSYGSFNAAIGTFLPLNETIDLELGYEYRHVSYEKIDTVVDKISYGSNLNMAYMGLNYRF